VPGRVEDTADWKSVERGVQFLHSRRKDDKPFFLFLPLMYPHCPYTVPEPYYRMYLDQKEKFALRPPCQGKPAYHELIRRHRQASLPRAVRPCTADRFGQLSHLPRYLRCDNQLYR